MRDCCHLSICPDLSVSSLVAGGTLLRETESCRPRRMPATRQPRLNFSKRTTKPMLIGASGPVLVIPCCVCNTSPEHLIIGILLSPTLLHLVERSFCSKAQVSGVPLARCLMRSP